jgi:uncharacterized protein YyaL (SSP411 family)
MGWLAASASACGDQCVSYGYDLRRGYLPPYPETTGYIIPTLYDYAARTGDEAWAVRARRFAEWEITLQLPTGAVQSGFHRAGAKQEPSVFNTGQVILGWVRAYQETGALDFRAAASRAGAWLYEMMDDDGCWRRQLSSMTAASPQASNVRTAWALATVGRLVNEDRWVEAARRNVDWTLRQQRRDGWVDHNTFYPHWPSLTHNIGYVMEGLLEMDRLLDIPAALQGVRRMAEKLLRLFEVRRHLPGGFRSGWKPDARPYRCLTGDAQIAGVWLQLYLGSRDLRYLNAALKLLDDVAVTQDLRSRNPGIRGGIGGSFPLHGFYSPIAYVSWAAKFFADSLMSAITRKQALLAEVTGPARGGPYTGKEVIFDRDNVTSNPRCPPP